MASKKFKSISAIMTIILFLSYFLIIAPQQKTSAATISIPNSVILAADDSIPCDGGSTLNPLTWVMCPVINGVVNGEKEIENFVFALLKTPIIPFSGNCNQQTTTGCTFQVWSSFRIYGNIVLVIALLIAIIVEIAGGGVVANYTIKKMLPRVIDDTECL